MANISGGVLKTVDDDHAGTSTAARFARYLVDVPEIGIIIAVLVAFAIFTSINSLFSSVSELQDLGIDLAGFGILAVGESFTIITGGSTFRPGRSPPSLCGVRLAAV